MLTGLGGSHLKPRSNVEVSRGDSQLLQTKVRPYNVHCRPKVDPSEKWRSRHKRDEQTCGEVNEPDAFPPEFFTQRYTSRPHQPATEGRRSVYPRWESSSAFRRAQPGVNCKTNA